MMKTVQWLHTLLPEAFLGDRYERLRICCGALIGILVTGLISYMLIGRSMALPFLIAPMGASAVLLYAVPSSPMAQPWPVIGGSVVSAAVGVAVAKLIADPPLAAAVAVGGAIGAMFLLRCLHPPGGAAALTAVLDDTVFQEHGFNYALSPVALNAMVMVLVAIIFNNLVRRQYPYPQPVKRPQQTADMPPSDRIGVTPDDLNTVLREYNQVLDISREELTTLLMQAEQQAYRRRAGEVTCANIMSRDVITVQRNTPLEEAWALMRQHRIKALPVIDANRHVIGIVTQSDFMKHAGLDELEDFGLRFRNFVRRSLRPGWEKSKLVGQIMSKPARTAKASAHIVELVPALSDGGFHHLPIVDEEDRLAGIVTQSDLVAALYRKRIVPSPVNAVSDNFA